MATITDFKCKKCGKTFTLSSGIFQQDLMNLRNGMDLPGGAKLPSKDEFSILYKHKTTERTEEFVNDLDKHSHQCEGEVVLKSIVSAH